MVADNAFDLTQPDLSHPIGWPFGPGNVVIIHGQNAPGDDGVHGAAALAVAIGRDNTVGGVGVAPEATASACCTLNRRNPPSFSTAEAIVAGAIVSTQSIAEHFLGSPCPPEQVRALVSDPALNTRSADPATDRIGVMPNLPRIIRRGLGIVPEVELVLRDFLSDDGWSAAPVALGNSPDIIVRRTTVENPQAEFGDAGVRPANAGSLADPSFVYLRAGNLGSRQASNVTAVVYWTGMDALLDPSRWHLIGTAQFPPVSPDANSVTVSHPLEWNGSQTPMPLFGECMLIAFLEGDGERPPTPWPAFASVDDLRAFVGASNNMAMRKLALQAYYLPTWWSRLFLMLRTTVRKWLRFTRD